MITSPFPGMDPFLEAPAYWPGLHARLVSAAAALLNELLPDPYVADIGERRYLVEPVRGIYPEGELARESFIRIVTVPDEEVVTVVEILSLANKAAGSFAHEAYRAKQQECLASSVHLVEIDLLRTGEHTVTAPRTAMTRIGSWDYLVCLHQVQREGQFQVWPVSLQDRLPCIAIPLKAGHRDIALDLQAVFDRAYAEGSYRRRLDYRLDPTVPLRPADAQWADGLLRDAGLR